MKPLYLRIHDDVVGLITSGALRPGDRVPSENELAQRYGASRLTAQRALREMVSRGFVNRTRGSGSYVSIGPWQFSLIEVCDPEQEIRARGGTPSRRLLAQEERPADPDLAETLGVEEGAPLYHTSVIECDRGLPVALVERWALPDVFPDFLQQDFATSSVFAYWASRTSLDEIDVKVAAILSDLRLGRLLEIDEGTPCLRLGRTNRIEGRVITLTRITFAGSRMELTSRYRPMDHARR